MLESQDPANLEHVVRALASASKALRLYPASSPIPRQTLQAAGEALEAYFRDGAQLVALTIVRDGFALNGQPFGASVTGARELADELRDHGVAELVIMPDCTTDELLAFLGATLTPAEEVRVHGGLATTLVTAGVDSIRVVDVHLTVVDQVVAPSGEDVDDFLRSLTSDQDRLAAWYAASASGDPAAFEEGLAELLRVAGQDGKDELLRTMSGAFRSQTPECRDALLGLAMEPGPMRELAGGMFRHLSSSDIAGSILGGTFGKNMLSLSSALTNLPLEQVTAQVRAEVQAMLPSAGHTPKEAEFLEHMMDVRRRKAPEEPLVDVDGTYRAVAQATYLSDDVLTHTRSSLSDARKTIGAASIHTMLRLLDQQKDFGLYCSAAENLAAIVPRLIEQGDLDLASKVLAELAARETFNSSPWPQLTAKLRDARSLAVGSGAMGALLRAVDGDDALIEVGRAIVRSSGDPGIAALIGEAIALKARGIELAEALVGRRVIDLLNEHAGSAHWYQLSPVVVRLAREGDARSLATIETLMRRPDEQSRREIVTGLAIAGGTAAQRLLGVAMRDASREVQVAAIRAVVRHAQQGSADLLAARLAELDVDNGDFVVARELINALAKLPGKAADDALARLASRRALIKRGHFGEVQELVKQALCARTAGGDG